MAAAYHARPPYPAEVFDVGRGAPGVGGLIARLASGRPPRHAEERRGRKKARRSSASSSGSSAAMKWPPRGNSVQRRMSA